MKLLFLIFHGFDEANGISKKIRYQTKALRECGADVRMCYYQITDDGNRRWMVNDEVIADLGSGKMAKAKKRFFFRPICEYAQREGIELVYIRSFHNANPFTINLIKELKRQVRHVVMEIPTYPYDQEYASTGMKLKLSLDRLFDTLLRRFAGPLLLLPFDLRLRHGRLLRSCGTRGEQEEDR